ncbi:MAG: ABC transporter permease, partial [Lachnospiraceae bacterium]|nr:ABC transporter permease [Lachnospiraceae bacterium]
MTLEMILEHLYLVAASCFFVVLLGVPVGILTYYYPRAGKVLLTVVDLIQT